MAEVFLVFLRLGCTSFGGPIAHLAYFRAEFVDRRCWLADKEFGELMALCHFLPGPTSSQVGMALGLRRAGGWGLLAAWLGFTLPSALLMTAAALGVLGLGGFGSDGGWWAGFKAAAVAVVAHALVGMARTLAPDRRRATIAVASLAAALLRPGQLTIVVAIAAAAVAGLIWLRDAPPPSSAASDGPRLPRAVGPACLALFGLLLALLPVLAAGGDPGVGLFERFYRTGSLVFGGGHVVLPLLQDEVVPSGLVSQDQFLVGYSLAQAMPGPMFTFAAYLGAVTQPAPSGVLGAAIALAGIFLPGMLLVIGVLPFWMRLRESAAARRAIDGVNAGVVGVLGAALFDPVFVQGAATPTAFVLAVAGFVGLSRWGLPPWAVVIGSGLLGWLLL